MTSPNFNKKAFVYLTVNKVNNKKYIGVRTYKNSINDDKYLGSGSAIKAAITKYGHNNFSRSTIFEGTATECYAYEKELVNQSIVDAPQYYNISLGGWGGYRGEEATERMKETLRNNYNNLPEYSKQARKDFLDSIRPLDLSKPKGKDSPHWIGSWVTPIGTFATCREAATANKIDARTLRNRCKARNNHVITKLRNGVIPKDWLGYSYKQLGWGFISKEV
jgi:hypothetical protein